MDTSKLGQFAAEGMDIFGAELEDYENAEISEVGIVIEVEFDHDDGKRHNTILTGCTNDSRVYQTGLWEWALEQSLDSGEPVPEDDDDEDEEEEA